MANAGRLAGLSALAGAAYLMSKNKDKESGATDTGDELDRLKARSPAPEKSAGEKAVSDTKSNVLTALQKPKNIREEGIAAANDVRTTPSEKSPAPVRKIQSAANNTTASKYPSGVMAGTYSNPSTVSSSEEGMKNYKPRRTPPASTNTVSSSEEGMKNYKPRRNPGAPANTVSSSEEGMKNYKPRVTPTPAPFKGGQPGYDEAGRFVGGQRGYDEAGNPMKKGGKVKKMASGGMTASKRADGIASRGKTKCKMY